MATKPRDMSNDVNMTPSILRQWMRDHNMGHKELAEWLGLTDQAVIHWLNGAREIPEPIGRLLNYFDLRPERMKDF